MYNTPAQFWTDEQFEQAIVDAEAKLTAMTLLEYVEWEDKAALKSEPDFF